MLRQILEAAIESGVTPGAAVVVGDVCRDLAEVSAGELDPGGAAASVDTLKSLLNQTTTAKARFAQTVLDKNNKPLQQATGTMEFSRPGRFRWEYNKPYEQTIVGDGSRLWIYDKDLNQVTVRKLARALGASPAALLAGSNEIEKSYALKSAGADGGRRRCGRRR